MMPLFLSCRAAIVAKTAATAANLHADAGRRAQLPAQARNYLALAKILLSPPSPRLIAVGGASGSGKSTVAMGIAPSIGAPPGAVVIRSDEIRKRLCGVKPFDRLGPEGYTGRPLMRKRKGWNRTSPSRRVRLSGYGHFAATMAMADSVM